MPREKRIELLRQLEEQRGSRVLCYVTSDRQNATGRIASDAIPWLYSHLRRFGKLDNLDLLIYSTGGVTMAGYRIAMLLKQACAERFAVLVPHKAHSAATLICLAASEIVMSAAGELSPIDPSTQSPSNPSPPGGGGPSPVQVEDVAGYFSLATNQVELDAMGLEQAEERSPALREAMTKEAFRGLVDKVHPLALGSVYRARRQIRMLANKLLSSHIEAERDRDDIIRQVTEALYSHDYPITRPEAVSMGLPVVEDERTQDLAWEVYLDYVDELRLLEPHNPEGRLGTGNETVVETELALVESTEAVDSFRQVQKVTRTTTPGPNGIPVTTFQQQIIAQGWHPRSDT